MICTMHKIATTGYGPFRTVALVKNMIVEE
jgi:hypothetical protein